MRAGSEKTKARLTARRGGAGRARLEHASRQRGTLGAAQTVRLKSKAREGFEPIPRKLVQVALTGR